jgi:hypothetical protein
MGDIAGWSQDEIKRIIRHSNDDSAAGSQRYVFWENKAIRDDYEFVPCECKSDCWCKRNGCTGHYRLKAISFHQFLDTYVHLWIPPSSRNNVNAAVLHSRPFNGRQRNAVPPLQSLRENWQDTLREARGYDKCGLCDSQIPLVIAVNNLYQAKMWSQLFYDSLVPFDTRSRHRIARAGYTDPIQNYMRMNRELFDDLKIMASRNDLDIADLRNLDTPWTAAQGMVVIPNGQPLSRVIDKMFYSPKPQ